MPEGMTVQENENKPVPNNTGIPTQLKNRFETKSGFSFDDVKVYYNSDKPASLQALAYTQGNQVYVGPGQEKHLSHELGHVVQQKAGIVRPTGYINGVAVNDNEGLEMGANIHLQLNTHLDTVAEPVIQRLAWYATKIGSIPKPVLTESAAENQTEKGQDTPFLTGIEALSNWTELKASNIDLSKIQTKVSGATAATTDAATKIVTKANAAVEKTINSKADNYYFASEEDVVNYGLLKAFGSRETANVVNVGQGTMVLHTVRDATGGKQRLLSDLGPNVDNLVLMLLYKLDLNKNIDLLYTVSHS